METLKVDLFEDEVFVFTPKGEIKSLAAGATPLDFAYEIRPPMSATAASARRSTAKIVPLSYQLRSGDIVEVLTSKRDRGPSRDWLALVKTTRARNKIKAWFKAESRKDTEHAGRELLQEHLKRQERLPAQKIVGSPLLADVIREIGFRKADDFYIALGNAKISPKTVVNKVLQRLKQGEAAEAEATAADDLLRTRRRRTRPTTSSSKFGISVEGIDEVMLRLAKCCRPVPGDPIVGYISLGRGITIHREDCPNVVVLKRDPERFTRVTWGGRRRDSSFRVEARSRRLGSAPGCSRICRGRLPRRGSTSSRRAARSTIRWSRTGSWSRWGTLARSTRRSAACATSTRCSTSTGSRRGRSSAAAPSRSRPGGVTLIVWARPPRSFRDQDRVAGLERFDRVGVDDELLGLAAGATGREAAEDAAADLPGLLPDLLGPGELGSQVCRLGHVLAQDQLDGGVTQDLVAHATSEAVEVGHLLSRDQTADPGLAPAREQRDHVGSADPGEFVDRDRRLLQLVTLSPLLEAIARRTDQILDGERAELRRELPVTARIPG